MKTKMKVVPPGNAQRLCGMHWLKINRYGSGDGGLIALQWNPGSQTWTHSNGHDSAFSGVFDTTGWEYIAPIPYPPLT